MTEELTSAWSRRRAAVAAEADAETLAQAKAATAAQHQVLAEKSEEEVLAELDLPNPDDMKGGDDFSVFMKSAVPSALRNRALRTLWRSNPILANVDMLVDYGEDFTGKGDVIGAIKTAYQVGKGFVQDKKPVEIEASDVAPEQEIDADLEEETPELAVQKAELPVLTETPAPAPRRRMRFEFVDDSASTTLGTE